MATAIKSTAIEAILFAVDIALDDQNSYLSIGNPHKDYGDEWPDTAIVKAIQFEELGRLLSNWGYLSTADRCINLAKCLRASGEEYNDPANKST